MASATKKKPSASSSPSLASRTERAVSPSLVDRLARGVDGIYRFLASLKLAVFSIATLAATLAYATFFESAYGMGASQDYIYRSAGFSILLAFLGMNILCAALIRFPWKKRQTGFVVTHAGLLTLLLGSFYSFRTADEGQVGMLEGDVKSELVRIDHPVIRIWEIDPHTRERMGEFDLPYHPGPFEWGRYDLRLMSWGDGSGVPTSGNNLVIVGIDNSGLLHIRIFDAGPEPVVDKDENNLPVTQAEAIKAGRWLRTTR